MQAASNADMQNVTNYMTFINKIYTRVCLFVTGRHKAPAGRPGQPCCGGSAPVFCYASDFPPADAAALAGAPSTRSSYGLVARAVFKGRPGRQEEGQAGQPGQEQAEKGRAQERHAKRRRGAPGRARDPAQERGTRA